MRAKIITIFIIGIIALASATAFATGEDAVAGSVAPSAPSAIYPAPTNSVACTQETKLCPDGSYVGRTGPNCEFAVCPSISASKPITAPCPALPTVDSCPAGYEKTVTYKSEECGVYYGCKAPPTAVSGFNATNVKKCGVNTFVVNNDCGVGAFKNAYVQCHDGYETTLGDATSCKSSETWQKYAKEACVNRCSTGKEPNSIPKLLPTPLTPPPAIDKPNTAPVNSCDEVAQWENKIAYYKKLGGSNDADLKKDGFSREEIERILKDLLFGLEKVKARCSSQNGTITMPPTAITGSISATETVKPVVVESGQEISAYYKTRLEKTISAKGGEKQIEELKALRDEIDGLIANLIKGRKELEVSELDNLVTEVKVSRGEIKADNIAVKTTEKKILVNVGASPVSIEPTASQVLIRDKGLEIKTDEVAIKGNALSIGGVEVKIPASEIVEKLGIAPKTIELKKENARAVYNMKVEEPRKLFGFIPFNVLKTVVADSANGNVLTERLPWYSFLTTK